MKSSFIKRIAREVAVAGIIFSMAAINIMASSHAEAPYTSMDRYADNTDIYAFRSTEAGRSEYVTLIANFIPFQDPSGGPQFFRFDDNVLYEIKIDNTGDGVEDIKYQFQFKTQIVNRNTVLGHTAVNDTATPGVVSSLTDPDYNMPQTYSVRRIEGNSNVRIANNLRTPPSNVGPRVTPDYEQNLGSQAIYSIFDGGRVFCGQRDEGFFVDVGAVFDGLGFRSLAPTGGVDTLRGLNVSTIAIEVPIDDLTRNHLVPTSPTASNAVIGVWSTASRRSVRVLSDYGGDGDSSNDFDFGAYRQISRLGNPLVNEVIVPLGLKDAFNSLKPRNDSILVPAVLDPELPKLIQAVFGLYGPLGGPPIALTIPQAPRNDLAQIFALGIPVNPITGPNYTTVIQGTNGPHEYMRLNLAISPSASPNRLGLLGGDVAGFPNGRRVTDDVVDIELRAAVGGTPFTPDFNVAPNNSVGDGVAANLEGFLTRFPYLQTPNPGNTPRQANFPATQTRGYLPLVDATGSLRK